MKSIKAIAADLMHSAVHLQGELDHANAKIVALTRRVQELQTNVTTKQKAVNKRDARITVLQASVKFYKTNGAKNKQELAEARSLLRKVKH